MQPCIVRCYGIKPEDVVDDVSPILNLIHPDDIGKVKESIAESFQSQSNWRMEFVIIIGKRCGLD